MNIITRKTVNLFSEGENHPLRFVVDRYKGNLNTRFLLVTLKNGYPEYWTELTANTKKKLNNNRILIDIYNNDASIIKWLTDNGFGFLTGEMVVRYPEFQFNWEVVSRYLQTQY